MKPKEKAIELYDNMYNSSFEMTEYSAKKCALIAVDEILNVLNSFGYNCTLYDGFENGSIISTNERPPDEYWQQVRQEIEQA